MDIVYQYYFNFLGKLGLSDVLIIVLWHILLFGLACVALCVSASLLIVFERSLSKFLNKGNFSFSTTDLEQEIFKSPKYSCQNILPILFIIPILAIWGIIPYSNKYIPVESDVSLLLFFLLMLIPIMGILFGGSSTKNKTIISASVKTTIVVLSFALSILFSIISVATLASSFNLNEIIAAQSLNKGALGWFVFPNIIAFFVLTSSILFFTDLLLGGLVDLRFSIFNLCSDRILKIINFLKYGVIFIFAIFIVCLFFGGYLPPFGFYLSELYQINYVLNTSAVYVEQIFWLFFKSMLVGSSLILIRFFTPVLDYKKLVKYSCIILLPCSILNFIIICIIKGISGGV